MANVQYLDVNTEELDIESEENESFEFKDDVIEVMNKFDLCVIGRFLTEKSINVKAM